MNITKTLALTLVIALAASTAALAGEAKLSGIDPRVYLHARKPTPDVVRELKRAPLDVSERILRADGDAALDAFLVDAGAYPSELKPADVAQLRTAERRALVIGALAAAAAKQRADLVELKLADADAAVRAEAAERFGEAGGAVDVIARIARDDADAVVRTAAVAGLARHRSAESLQALSAFVVDASDNARQLAAIRALPTLCSRWAWEAKGDVAQGARLRAQALDTLARVERKGDVGRAVDDVERALR